MQIKFFTVCFFNDLHLFSSRPKHFLFPSSSLFKSLSLVRQTNNTRWVSNSNWFSLYKIHSVRKIWPKKKSNGRWIFLTFFFSFFLSYFHSFLLFRSRNIFWKKVEERMITKIQIQGETLIIDQLLGCLKCKIADFLRSLAARRVAVMMMMMMRRRRK